MILSVISWGPTEEQIGKDVEFDEFMTAEIHLDEKQAWQAIDQVKSIRKVENIKNIEFFIIRGHHTD